MTCYFLDTSALQHRYCRGTHSKGIRRIVSDPHHEKYIAEITVLEIASTLAKKARERGWTTRMFGNLDKAFWEDVADGRLQVRNVDQRIALRARHLIRYAGVIRKRRIGTLDAMIASCCLDLALELKERVIFYTGDWPLYSILHEISAFRSALCLRFLGKGRAGIPTRTC